MTVLFDGSKDVRTRYPGVFVPSNDHMT